MANTAVKEEIGASADRLWALVVDFGKIDWIPGAEGARTEGKGPGMVRILGAPGAEIRERLESVDEARRQIAYTIPVGNPLPVTDYRATMTVHARGADRSELEWACTFEPKADVSEADVTAQVHGLYGMLIGWIRDKLGAG
ncbi:MAG: SRPBCC family protein [Deltaproteobacteria bacterium]|nr:SRPBCC family protein [Deltaproteobacteria bacterium]